MFPSDVRFVSLCEATTKFIDPIESEVQNMDAFRTRVTAASDVVPIFRGDCLSCLMAALDTTEFRSYASTAAQLFVVGVKSRAKLDDSARAARRAHIEDSTAAISVKLFKKINNIVEKMNQGRVANIQLAKRLADVSEHSSEFWSYFGDRTKKGDFKSKFEQMEETFRREALMYYASFLHTVGKIGLEGDYHLSASTSYDEAAAFARNRKHDCESPCPIVMVGWVPPATLPYGDAQCASPVASELQANSLPVLNEALWPEQKEICLRAGWFAHYILGYHNLKDGTFVLNPKLRYATPDEVTLRSGFIINFRDFLNALEATNYARYVMRIDERRFKTIAAPPKATNGSNGTNDNSKIASS